jgi:lysophospholipid acyltransferase (LPLAT)-like uncharacterized protein
MKQGLRFEAAGRLGALFLKGLGRTLRVRVEADEALREFRRQRQPVVFVFWHSRILPLAYLHRNEGIVVLVSQHEDGEYIARTIENMGFGTARGSSTRGGVRGLRGLIRAARQGHDLGFTPDGPRGPARKFKTGALVAAQLLGAPIVPLTAGGPGLWRLNSWDRSVIPKPFASLTLAYAPPRFIPRHSTEEELADHAAALEAELNRITDQVDGRGDTVGRRV